MTHATAIVFSFSAHFKEPNSIHAWSMVTNSGTESRRQNWEKNTTETLVEITHAFDYKELFHDGVSVKTDYCKLGWFLAKEKTNMALPMAAGAAVEFSFSVCLQSIAKSAGSRARMHRKCEANNQTASSDSWRTKACIYREEGRHWLSRPDVEWKSCAQESQSASFWLNIPEVVEIDKEMSPRSTDFGKGVLGVPFPRSVPSSVWKLAKNLNNHVAIYRFSLRLQDKCRFPFLQRSRK